MVNDTKTEIFNSSIGSLLPASMREGMFSLNEKAALLLRSVRGYKIVYLINSENAICSWCFLKKDYLKKYPFMKKNDFLINPYYTIPQYRGQGYGQRLIKSVTEIDGYENIYALVKKDNNASISVLEKCGFERIGYSGKKFWPHIVSQNEGSIIIFRYKQV